MLPNICGVIIGIADKSNLYEGIEKQFQSPQLDLRTLNILI